MVISTSSLLDNLTRSGGRAVPANYRLSYSLLSFTPVIVMPRTVWEQVLRTWQKIEGEDPIANPYRIQRYGHCPFAATEQTWGYYHSLGMEIEGVDADSITLSVSAMDMLNGGQNDHLAQYAVRSLQTLFLVLNNAPIDAGGLQQGQKLLINPIKDGSLGYAFQAIIPANHLEKIRALSDHNAATNLIRVKGAGHKMTSRLSKEKDSDKVHPTYFGVRLKEERDALNLQLYYGSTQPIEGTVSYPAQGGQNLVITTPPLTAGDYLVLLASLSALSDLL